MDIKDRWYMYLRKERNLSGKVIQRANLHEVNDWLAIPVYNKEGKHIFDKFRKGPWMDSSLPKYRYQTGSQASLYNIHLLTKEVRKVYITEGELDSLALETCKLVSVSSTGGSQTWRDEWTKEMEGKHVIVLYDNDEAGIKGAVKLAFQLRKFEYRWIPPRFGKDASDVLKEYGEEKLLEILTEESSRIYMDVPDLFEDKDILQYRKTLNSILIPMSSGSVGTLFLREMILRLTSMIKVRNKPAVKRDNSSEIESARLYPIDQIISVKQGFANCPFHKDRTASLKVYNDNHAYCFGGCGKRYDSIDIYAKINDLNFQETIKKLSS